MSELEKVDASPTKDFFIDMITRDITLNRAILDLIDNSVDAANKTERLTDREIKIFFDDNEFRIWDNCGGFSKSDAKNYAFKFGRDENTPTSDNSVGQFGVGLKRTLFKLGRKFRVSSWKGDDKFTVSCDVDNWMKEDGEWKFGMSNESDSSLNDGETLIIVTSLTESSKTMFDVQHLRDKLNAEISMAHFLAIEGGLKIYVNDVLIATSSLEVKTSDSFPAFNIQKKFYGVDVTIKAGVTGREYEDGGWYISCNGRLVLSADQSVMTGWGDGIANYHADFAFFRGLVEFTAQDSSLLPWTTTKTGVDYGNKVYQAALTEMKAITRQFQSLLRDLAREASDFKDGLIKERPIHETIEKGALVNMYHLSANDEFVRPAAAVRPDTQKWVSVQYSVLKKDKEIAAKMMGVSSATDVGRLSFDYFFERECEDE